MNRNRIVALALGLTALLSGMPAWAVAPSAEGRTYEVPVPLGMSSPIYSQPTHEEAAALLPGWERFAAQEGSRWVVGNVRQDLGTPAALFGPGIEIAAAGLDGVTLRDAAIRFVREHQDILKSDATNLTLAEVRDLGDITQFRFQQTHEGLEVLGGTVELFVRDGKVVLVGSEFYPSVTVPTVPTLDFDGAQSAAVAGMPFGSAPGDHFDGTPRLVVYPMILQSAPTYFLAYEVQIRTEEPEGWYYAYVDATDGEVLTRVNHLATFDIPVSVSGDLHPLSALDPLSTYDQPNHYVRGNNTNFYTDANGFVNVTVPLNQAYTITSNIKGLWGDSNNNPPTGTDASFSASGSPGVPLDIHWTDSNSTSAERDAYFFVDKTHTWIKTLDPGYTGMDFVCPANVNRTDGTCNAFWNGGSVNFYAAGGGCNNTGNISTVIEHEYGHGITQFTYSPSAPPTSSGMGEGFSDVVSNTMENDAIVGRGFNNGGGYIRNAENLRQYPATECGGEVHCLGEVLMGALWKTRKNFVTTYGYATGVANYESRMRTAWETKQYSVPNYLTRYLMADDNNADLADGTPNWYDICDAFALHNVNCPAITKFVQFTHTALDDQLSTVSPYTVTSLIQSVNAGTLDASSIKIYYSTDLGQNWPFVAMTATGNPNEYQGAIPAQPCGSLVWYYIYAQTNTGIFGTEPARAPEKNVHKFMTGPNLTDLNDTFESNLGWTVGGGGDTAFDGIWERVNPVGKTNPNTNEVVQPEDDHTPGAGTLCYVTNGVGGFYTNNDVDGGYTTIQSPVFDWSSDSGVGKIDFWAFFANETVIDDSVNVSVSNNGGTSYTRLSSISGRDANAWNHYTAYFSDSDVPFTNQMRFRVRIGDFNSSLTEGAVDDIVIRHTDCATVDVGDGLVPTEFSVLQNRPNPFHGGTDIRFAMPAAGVVQVEVFDAAGRLVRTLENQELDAGYHTVSWDGRDTNRRTVGAGVYYYRVQHAGRELTRKMLFLK